MKDIIATVAEHFYEDNYEEGEVTGTYTITDIDTCCFNSIEEAIKWFVDKYEDCEFKVEMIDDATFCAARGVQAQGEYGFRSAHTNEVDAWKRGDINLYSLEYQMKLSKVAPIQGDELKNIALKMGISE